MIGGQILVGLSWALWNFDWQPEHTGECQLVVRATDANGLLQVSEERGRAEMRQPVITKVSPAL